ncbi:hypothetical protein B1199_13985 [Pseudoalteromonas ulvae]|uniref:Uncharacterized protein n=2 Tax=Pseudoalteromonas ulvae TaxID=107327 RepID=A0A244CNU7_PSEDV|nr:transporter substrate-binding domain-containing protein [Pseudoalteromonas ulvae]OUL57272.1 hypothetical protein B1199_13985 [Pseudoalteromonas ulvae]
MSVLTLVYTEQNFTESYTINRKSTLFFEFIGIVGHSYNKTPFGNDMFTLHRLVFLLLLINVSVLAAPDVRLKYDLSASNGLIPYYNNDPDFPGIFPEFIHLVLKEANIQGESIVLPPARTQLALARGELDFDIISPSWFKNHKIPKGFVLSDPLLKMTEHLIYLPQKEQFFTNNKSILGQTVGTVRGYFYHDDDTFFRFDLISEKEIIQALYKERIDVGISGDLPALFWSQKLNIPIQLGPIHSQGYVHIRLRDEHQHLLPQLNKALNNLIEKGTLDVIVQRYLQIMAYSNTPQSTSEK